MTKKIILISCVSQKLSHRAKAKDLYISTLFTLNRKYAEKLNPDKIFVLSAKHGLLDMEQEIEMLKSLYRNATDEEEDPDAEDNIVPLFDKDKLH